MRTRAKNAARDDWTAWGTSRNDTRIADGVMIGRGAIGKPWVFYQLKHELEDIDNSIKKEIILEHYDKMLEFHGDYGAIIFRKLLHAYSKGYTGANEFRDLVNQISDKNIMRDLIESFF